MNGNEKKRRFACLSDIGTKRKNNEDAAYCASSPFGTLLVVADGMGGHRKGEIASKIVTDELSYPFSQNRRGFSPERARKFLHRALKKANKRIHALGLSGDDYKEMGTTVVCCLVTKEKAVVCNVGDSRCYAYRKETGLTEVTTDQTYVELLFETGKITKKEMENHPQRNLLINAIGINASLVEIQDLEVDLAAVDKLLLCSDGLYNAVSKEEMAALVAQDVDVSQIAHDLIAKALANKGTDNIAVSLWEKE